MSKVYLKKLAELSKQNGGQNRLARLIGVAPQNLNAYIRGRRAIPLSKAKEVIEFAKKEGFEIGIFDLRPDLQWLNSEFLSK